MPRSAAVRSANLKPLLVVAFAGVAFAALLVLVRLQWAPLESVDRGTANDLNRLVAPHHVLVSVI
jgi:hypothetical protein